MTSNMAKCLLVSKVLVADGIMAEGERAFLAGLMDKLGLDVEEQRSVIELEGWDEAEGIVNELPLEQKLELVELLVDAASADGKLSPTELATIQRVEAALGIK
jgi:uncharacterized tellurite resistance protein B-like protein